VIELNMFASRSAEDHRAETTVADGQSLGPDLRWLVEE
jgi:hypothetical protein